ncbi:protein-export chaperone SecB [uncultured Duncaniella sp.]|uniref:protein-export chaperone SecB n=1 Tax=uncultured Duncaniella sp. TaxID=2768039 RepID=UPI00272D613C|nr:protein-export chaperone SecB [uncultured Duncaniella sp.]
MKIQLKEWRVKDLVLTSKQESSFSESNDNKFQLSFGHALYPDNPQEFIIGFKIGINETMFSIALEMAFIFETDSKIDENFKDSSFLKINAPAIAFPYIRAYISNLTLQSGYDSIILPSINFVSLNEKNK